VFVSKTSRVAAAVRHMHGDPAAPVMRMVNGAALHTYICVAKPSHPCARSSSFTIAACLAALFLASLPIQAAAPGRTIIPMLQERLGLNETQVRGALGALLVFVRERLPKPDFDDLAETIPNADRIMQDVKLSGVVTRPLDDMDDYEAALSNLGIGQPLASQFAPAVMQSLAETGHSRERDILARVIG
jgi:hypothetical protein